MVKYIHGMAFLFELLHGKFDENKFSVLDDATTIDVFVIVVPGFNTDANCKRDCFNIDFDEEPNSESANGLFLNKSLSSSVEK